MITESELEAQAITWFQDTGWEFRHGPTSRRTGTRRTRGLPPSTVNGTFVRGFAPADPEIPEIVLEDAFRRIAKPDHPSLVFKNRSFHEALLNGVPVETEVGGEKRGDRVGWSTSNSRSATAS